MNSMVARAPAVSRVAAKGGIESPLNRLGHFRGGDGGAHGQPVGEAFGEGHDFGLHIPVLDAEPVVPVRPKPVCTSSQMKTPP